MNCSKCGKLNDAEAVFCEHCGNSLKTQTCLTCGQENDPDTKFCIRCGTSFQPIICPACHAENEPGGKFCIRCGKPLGKAAAPPAKERSARRRLPAFAWVLIGVIAAGLITAALLLFKPWERLTTAPVAPTQTLPMSATKTPASSPTDPPLPTATTDPYITWLLSTGLNLSSPRIISLEPFEDWDDEGWNWSENVSVVWSDSGKSLQLPGEPTFATWLVAPPIDPGNGILTKFMLSGTRVEFFLVKNEWDTSSYRRFGGAFYDGDRMETTIWKGTDGHLSGENMDGTLIFHSGQWYGLFIGMDRSGNFRLVAWDWEDPEQYIWHDFSGGEGWQGGQWWFDVQVDEGTVMLDDYHVIAFDGIQALR